MSPKIIVLTPEAKGRCQARARCCAHRPMVAAHLLDECPGLPAFHPCRRHRDPVDSTAFYWQIAADLFETFSPEELARARDVFHGSESEVISGRALGEWRSHYSESLVCGQLREQKVEIVLVEGDISIEVPDDIEILALHPLVACVEALDFAGEVPVSALGHPYQFHPWVVGEIPRDNFVSAVCRAIAHNHPFP